MGAGLWGAEQTESASLPPVNSLVSQPVMRPSRGLRAAPCPLPARGAAAACGQPEGEQARGVLQLRFMLQTAVFLQERLRCGAAVRAAAPLPAAGDVGILGGCWVAAGGAGCLSRLSVRALPTPASGWAPHCPPPQGTGQAPCHPTHGRLF